MTETYEEMYVSLFELLEILFFNLNQCVITFMPGILAPMQ